MTLALYRTYRPGRFADVVGQEHVTNPLARALERNKVHHAYLFSGPRGCGKTSSARILARSLNCEQGPTPEPCGQCQSCQDLAPNGPGNLDVVEIDAATHGLVDDARELRQQAHFSPSGSRYRIYIIDEAHQLGPAAANALLKIIEEPPAHLKFIFATTAADKILGTIRSRTHQYPFRLVPARTLAQHLTWVCEQEGITAEASGLALVTRAAGGSVRDALSILGQLAAGADEDGITHAAAVALLGFTDEALLDETIRALTDEDAQTLFVTVDRVLESGHDPRRFLTDLLERLRDLILIRAAPEAAGSGLVEAPADRAEVLKRQSESLTPAQLVRLADIVEAGIAGMKGATPTRLQLELVCARLVVEMADDGSSAPPGAARNDAAAQQSSPRRASQPLESTSGTRGDPPATPGTSPPRGSERGTTPPTAARSSTPAEPGDAAAAPARPPAQPDEPPMAPPTVDAAASSESGARQVGLAQMRQMWPEVLERLREIRRVPWSFISQNTEVLDASDGVLTLVVTNPRLRDQLVGREDFIDPLRRALSDVLSGQWRVEAVVGGTPPAKAPSSRGTPAPAASEAGERSTGAAGPATSAKPARAERNGGRTDQGVTADDDVSPDDQALDDLSGEQLLARELGATVIDPVEGR